MEFRNDGVAAVTREDDFGHVQPLYFASETMADRRDLAGRDA